jgi:hypothetical protein
MQIGRLAAATVAIGVVGSGDSQAQPPGGSLACGERDDMVQRLERTFGEVQKGAGLVSAAQLLEVWGSDETGTWTILMTDAQGWSCVVAAGEAWRDIEAKLARGDPT